TPIIVSFVTVAVLSAQWSQHHFFGTLRCRLGRAATTPSDSESVLVREVGMDGSSSINGFAQAAAGCN
ncbi:hypothetical protein, partial [Sphingobium psychrophilum]|uniref:hypothetical protein n=1 Tax=Sphingobium psychrophilum TaxID=2728834 RepID=UPI0019D15A1F